MRLSDVWFTALSENESGQMITVYGRDELNEFTESGKFKERVEITWKYEGDGRGLPSDDLGEKMEASFLLCLHSKSEVHDPRP